MDRLGLLTSLVPLAGAGIIIREIRLARRLRNVGIEVVGRIVRQRLRSGRSGSYFIPTARFATQRGQVIVTESAGYITRPKFFNEEDVVLYYDPDYPARFLFAEELGSGSRYIYLALSVLLAPFIWWVAWTQP
jgi:hypothetical protein